MGKIQSEHIRLMKIQANTVKKIMAYPAMATLAAVCCSCSDEGNKSTYPPTQPEKQETPKRLPQATSGMFAPVETMERTPQPYSGLMAPDVNPPKRNPQNTAGSVPCPPVER